jgi:hypothetical protein
VEEEADDIYLAGMPIDFRLNDLEEELTLIAQSGASKANEKAKWLSAKADELDGCGLTVLARAVARLGSDSTEARRGLLACRYLCLLHRQAAAKAGQDF